MANLGRDKHENNRYRPGRTEWLFVTVETEANYIFAYRDATEPVAIVCPRCSALFTESRSNFPRDCIVRTERFQFQAKHTIDRRFRS